MKKLKYVKLFENLISYEDETDMKDLIVLLKSGMLNGEDLIRMLQDTGMMTKENTALIQIQGMSRSGFGKLTYGARIVLNGKDNLINENAQDQITGPEIIKLAKAEAAAMGARFAFRNLNWFLKFYDLQNKIDYAIEGRHALQSMTDLLGIKSMTDLLGISPFDSDDPHLDESNNDGIETSDEYIALNKAGLIPPIINVDIETGYYQTDEDYDYDQMSIDCANELKNWVGPTDLLILKANIVLQSAAYSDDYIGGMNYWVMLNDRAVIKIQKIVHKTVPIVAEYSYTKNKITTDLRDKFNDMKLKYDYADPVHSETGRLDITQPLQFVIDHSGFYK